MILHSSFLRYADGSMRGAVLQGTTVVVASHDKAWLDELDADSLKLGE